MDRPILKIHPAYPFKPGQSATAIGRPGVGDRLLENAISIGVMSTKLNEGGRVRYEMNMTVNHGNAVNHGNSGGPLHVPSSSDRDCWDCPLNCRSGR
jgi:S1-C subfamily serine protease